MHMAFCADYADKAERRSRCHVADILEVQHDMDKWLQL